MANAFYGDRWVIDTPSATPVTLQSVFVKHVRWQGQNLTGVGGAPEAKITDNGAKTRWHKYALGVIAAFDDQIENWWYDGFTVPTLDGGELIIDLK